MDQLFTIIAGAILLFCGRRLFWLFVGLVGFLFGLESTLSLLDQQPQVIAYVVGALMGLLGAVLAMFLQRIAFGLGGFYAGGYLGLMLANQLQGGENSTVWFVVAGLVGAVFAVLLMDWAIVILSALAGAGAIVSGIVGLDGGVTAIVFIVLFFVGCAVQGRLGGEQHERW